MHPRAGAPPLIAMLDPAVQAQLAAILPPAALLTTTEETRPYECDGLTMYRTVPAAVAIPENEAQVVAILKRCHEARVPVVARGAGTSLSGGAMPDRNGVVLSLAKFKRILAIDPLARTAVVQPGVRNLAISEAAAVHGLYYAPDPSSQIACTIGGNVAENSGGLRGLKYGITRNYVMGLEVVLPDGQVLWTGNKCVKDVAGFSLKDLFIGSEGTLGVITQVLLRLIPKPAAKKTVKTGDPLKGRTKPKMDENVCTQPEAVVSESLCCCEEVCC